MQYLKPHDVSKEVLKMKEVRLEKLPGEHETAAIFLWHVEEGDRIEELSPLVKLSIDGKTFTLASPAAGMIHEIYFEEGEEAHVGDVLATIDEEDTGEVKEEEELEDAL